MQEHTTQNLTELTDGKTSLPSITKQHYHAPTLTCYGGLVELVQAKDGVGPDGSPFPDCRLP